MVPLTVHVSLLGFVLHLAPCELQIKTLEHLLGYINHEIRNPLNVLAAGVDFIERKVVQWGGGKKLQGEEEEEDAFEDIDDDGSTATAQSSAGGRSSFTVLDESETKSTATMPELSPSSLPYDEEDASPFNASSMYGTAPPMRIGSFKPNTMALPALPPTPQAMPPFDSVEQSNLQHAQSFTQDVASDVAAMKTAVMQLQRHVNDMLDFQQLNNGTLRVFPARTNFQKLLARIVQQNRLLTPIPIHVEVEVGVGLPYFPSSLLLDTLRVQQLLTNGLSNAIKYTKQGDITVVARVDRTTDSPLDTSAPFPCILTVCVYDTGPGLGGVDPSKLFEVFSGEGKASPIAQRRGSDPSQTDPFGRHYTALPSSGFGLPVCRLLAQRLGGTVSLSERSNVPGCCFEFTLPVEADCRRSMKVETMVHAPSRGTGLRTAPSTRSSTMPSTTARSPLSGFKPLKSRVSRRSGLRILVADDSPLNAKIAAQMLRNLGCHVHSISGSDMIERLEERLMEDGLLMPPSSPRAAATTGMAKTMTKQKPAPLDALFLDLRIGDRNMLEVLQSWRHRWNMDVAQPMKVAVTGSFPPECEEAFQAAGVQGGLLKPLSVHSCQVALDYLLKHTPKDPIFLVRGP